MEKRNTQASKVMEVALNLLVSEVGEPLWLRSAGRFLASEGLGTVPLDDWGLFILTPTRLLFRRDHQAHPLFGGHGDSIRWETPRALWSSVEAVKQKFWTKLFSGTPDHVVLQGEGVRLVLETADPPETFVRAWRDDPPLDPHLDQK